MESDVLTIHEGIVNVLFSKFDNFVHILFLD